MYFLRSSSAVQMVPLPFTARGNFEPSIVKSGTSRGWPAACAAGAWACIDGRGSA